MPIETSVPGPWQVDNSRVGSWGIINVETGRKKFIGRAGYSRHSKVNWFDRAMEEAERRNRELNNERAATTTAGVDVG